MITTMMKSVFAAAVLGFAALTHAGNGAVHTYTPVSDADCDPGIGGLEYCWETTGHIYAVYTPSGNVHGKSVTHTYTRVLYFGELIQEVNEIYERKGMFKDGEPFVWKSDRTGEVCTVNPYTGESTITTWTYRFANGEFRRQDIEVTYGECPSEESP